MRKMSRALTSSTLKWSEYKRVPRNVQVGMSTVAPSTINICFFNEAGAWEFALSVARTCDAVAKVVVSRSF
jgi:hypothetical protein